MEKDNIIRKGERYLNKCLKNMSIVEIEELTLVEKDNKIFFEGDENLLKEAFKEIEKISIIEKEIILKDNFFNIEELKEIVKELNQQIKDFNLYSKKREPISFL